MEQPSLGRKISELRRAKGLTQGELADQCNLSLRTVQRIESAEVTPRSYTVKQIFASLGYDFYNSPESSSSNERRLTQFYNYVSDLFNLKTNTMKKITILSVPTLTLLLLFLFTGLDSRAQDKKVKEVITEMNTNLVKWFNSGQIDAVAGIYSEKCVVVPATGGEINGRKDVAEYYHTLYNSGFRLKSNTSTSVTVTDTIAVERCIWTSAEPKMSGTYLTQWKLINGKWYIENEMTNAELSK